MEHPERETVDLPPEHLRDQIISVIIWDEMVQRKGVLGYPPSQSRHEGILLAALSDWFFSDPQMV